MVPLAILDASLERLSDEAAVEQAMLQFATEQTPFVQYLQTDTFDLLTDDERAYLQYLALVIYGAFRQNTEAEHPAELPGQAIEEWEERCWDYMQATPGKPMRDRLDVFYEKIDEEELLAFAEDSLVDPDREDDDDGEVALFDTSASRELAFVTLAVLVGGLSE